MTGAGFAYSCTVTYSCLLSWSAQEAKAAIRNGTIPCTKDMAFILAATQIHIEDLAAADRFKMDARPFPAGTKAKYYMPLTFKVAQHPRVIHLSSSDI